MKKKENQKEYTKMKNEYAKERYEKKQRKISRICTRLC